jgi:hypothetical protein
MKSVLIICGALAVFVATGATAVRLADAASSSPKAAQPTPAKATCDPRAISVFGFVKSLTRSGRRYELQFDPALMLSGVTASRAAREDTGSGDVSNDYYLVNESTRAYTYLVPEDAQVRVLTPNAYFDGTPVSVEQLAALLKGEKPIKLFGSLESGFWLRYYNDTACSLKQQYRP